MVWFRPLKHLSRPFTTAAKPNTNQITILGNSYVKDDYTNVTSRILDHVGSNLHLHNNHPLNLVHQRIVNYFHKTFLTSGKPAFKVFNELKPVVSVNQNFDSLLIPKDHVSRSKSDCYYVNRDYLLRAHMTAHQAELLAGGFKNFLMIGDVYRRDEIDRTHYPVFHQVDAVRLRSREDLSTEIFDNNGSTDYDGIQAKQECHSLEAVKTMEDELKNTLLGLVKCLFGDVKYRWVETTFPFTQPSWELEVFFNDNWLELLGCGIMKHSILTNAGVHDNIGWAFGIGLERVAMCLYKIPDIRLFWSKDSGFLNQFNLPDINQNITYKEISQFPQCTNDLSFWLPDSDFSSNDFYDLVRDEGGNIVEQVELIDNFTHPKTKKTSHCYRITYRHMERTLTQKEVNWVHQRISDIAQTKLLVKVR